MNKETELRARELLAAEYDVAEPGSKMATLVRSGAHLNENGVHAAAIRAIIAAFSAAAEREAPCSMGVGCDEAGVCYAVANGQPDQCPKAGPGDIEIMTRRKVS